MNERRFLSDKKKYYLVLTLAFLIISAAVLCYYYLNGKTLIHFIDGWWQHYKALVYYGQYLREIAGNLFSGASPVIPDWNFYVGEGSDILNTFHFYVIGDPLNLLSAIVPSRYTYALYDFLVMFRIYLSGIAFSALCFGLKKKNYYGIFAGAVSYMFCFWAILNIYNHPFFLNPMIYFPLMILGVEYIIRDRKPFLMIIITALSGASSFYYFYMLALLTVVYTFIRVIYLYRKNIREIVLSILRILLASVLGVMIAGMLLLPVFYIFMSDSRFGLEHASMLFYPLKFYSALPGIFISLGTSYWFSIGMAPPVILAIFLLFIRKKQNTLLKILFIAGMIMVIFPVFSRIMNGFSYYAGRWSWGIVLLGCFILTVMWEELINVTRKEQMILFICCCGLAVLCIICGKSRNLQSFVSILLMLIVLMMIFLFGQDSSRKDMLQKLICLAVCISVVITGYWENSVGYDNAASLTMNAETAREGTLAEEPMAIKAYSGGDFFRYTGRNLNYNANILGKVSSTSQYWSISNPYVNQFRSDLLMAEDLLHQFRGYDDRTSLITLAGVDYYTAYGWYCQGVPYGFEYLGSYNVQEGKTARYQERLKEELNAQSLTEAQAEKILSQTYSGYAVYRNNYTLPLGYCYDSYFTGEDWEKMNPVQRQQNMLDAVYLMDTEPDISRYSFTEDKDQYYIDFVSQCDSQEISQDGDRIIVTEPDSTMTLYFEGKPGCETYVEFDSMEFDGTSPHELYFGDESVDPYNLYSRANWDLLDYQIRTHYILTDRYYTDPTLVSMTFECSEGSWKYLQYRTAADDFYGGRHDFIVNLGYFDNPVSWITITFPETGVYTIENMKVACVPYADYPEKMAALGESGLQNIEFGTNSVSGSVSLDKNKVMCIAIPYSQGWKAFVDEEEVPVFIANGRYLGIELSPGDHQIRLTYATPMKKAGYMISACGIVIFIVFAVIYRRRSRLKNKPEK